MSEITAVPDRITTYQLEVSRIYTTSGVITREEADKLPPLAIRVRDPKICPLGSVFFSAGFTKNLGNYQSCKVTVGVTLPCLPEEVQDAMEVAGKFVDAELLKQRTALDS